MQILFFESGYGTLADTLYALFTGGYFSRVQLQFSDGKRFGVDLHSGKLEYDKHPIVSHQWTIEELPCYESLVREWCDKHVSIKFKRITFLRWIGAINNRYLGSIAVKEALEYGGYEDLPSFVNPNSLYEWTIEWNLHHPPPYYDGCGCNSLNVPETLYWD